MNVRIGYKAKNQTSCFICFLKKSKDIQEKPVPALS